MGIFQKCINKKPSFLGEGQSKDIILRGVKI